jgi:hypothetical protein
MQGGPLVCWTTNVPKDVWLGCVGKWLDPTSVNSLMLCNKALYTVYQEHPYARWIKYAPEAGLRMAVMANNDVFTRYYKEKLTPQAVERILSGRTTIIKYSGRSPHTNPEFMPNLRQLICHVGAPLGHSGPSLSSNFRHNKRRKWEM